MQAKRTPEERFWAKVEKSGPVPDYRPELGPCWLWTGRPTHYGYGNLKVARRDVYAHRFAYELLVGPIPEGLTIDHLCRVRLCVNTRHMEPVTNQINTRRGFGVATLNSTKTHCPQGHPYDAANTHWYKAGRYCRACQQAADQKRRPRHRQDRARRQPCQGTRGRTNYAPPPVVTCNEMIVGATNTGSPFR